MIAVPVSPFCSFLLVGRGVHSFPCDVCRMGTDKCEDAGRGAAGGGGVEWVPSGVVRLEDVFFACEWEVAVAL